MIVNLRFPLKPLNRSTWLLAFLLVAFSVSVSPLSAVVIDFEELTTFTSTGENGAYFNGNLNDTASNDGWTSQGVLFGNQYSPEFGGFWSGWSYSTVQDATTAGFSNQYAAFSGSGYQGSATYAVGFASESLFINLPPDLRPVSAQLTNSTYAAYSMLQGDAFAKKFGGPTGTDPDHLTVTILGHEQPNAQGPVTGSVSFALADFRFDDQTLDYVVDTWQQVDLEGLGAARSLGFAFESTDVGEFGINTPTYLALDQLILRAVPEPRGAASLAAVSLCLCLSRRRKQVPSSRTLPCHRLATVDRMEMARDRL